MVCKTIIFPVGPAAEHLVGNNDEVFALGCKTLQPVQDGFGRVFPCSRRVVQLVGGKVAKVFQQGGAPRRQAHIVQMQGTLHRHKLLCGPHFAVLFHPGGTLGIPHLHGGKIVAWAGGPEHKALGVFTFAAGRAAQNQRQHWGVYGAMPPSAKE